MGAIHLYLPVERKRNRNRNRKRKRARMCVSGESTCVCPGAPLSPALNDLISRADLTVLDDAFAFPTDFPLHHYCIFLAFLDQQRGYLFHPPSDTMNKERYYTLNNVSSNENNNFFSTLFEKGIDYFRSLKNQEDFLLPHPHLHHLLLLLLFFWKKNQTNPCS